MCCGKSSISGIKVSPGLCKLVSALSSRQTDMVGGPRGKGQEAMEGTKDLI